MKFQDYSAKYISFVPKAEIAFDMLIHNRAEPQDMPNNNHSVARAEDYVCNKPIYIKNHQRFRHFIET